MKEIETIVEMITRFTDIVNGLEALGKTYKKFEKVLIGSLMTYEINLTKKLQEGEDKKKKSIALKATTKKEEDVEEEKPSDEDDDLALITRKLNKYMRGERFRGRKFTSRRDPSKKESSSHGDKEKWDEKRDLTCFKCKKPGQIKYDCPLYKSESKRRMKKAMMATWSESEESSKEENEKEVANICFMVIDDLDEGSKKDKWLLDSGCSRHMTGDESKFAFLTKRNGGYVTFGDNSKGRIIGQGNIGLETSMRKLQIEDRRQQEEVVEDPKKKESPLALSPPQKVQGESSQDLPKNWKFVINHPQYQIIEFSKCMHSEFEMSMMGELNFFLGLQIKQLKEGTFINQAKSIRDLLKRFNMEEAKTMKTPMSSSIKLDMDEKGKPVNSTMYRGMIGLWYPKGDNFELIGYSNVDFAGCKVERKSTSDICHFLGHSVVSWHSKKQHSIALSTTEVEYIAVGLYCAQILWMKQTLSDFNLIFEHVPIQCDNTSTINISKNPVQHSKTKHIEIRHHFLRDHAQKGDITLEFISDRLQAMHLILGRLEGWFSFISVHLGLRGKRPAEPSQPEQTEAGQKASFDMALFSSIEDYQRYKQKFAQRKVILRRSVNFSQLQHFGLSPESICRILDIPSVGLRVYEAKAWPTVPGFEPRKVVQRLCGLADV
ncbi:Retrovirus-related Pol polyprotein from transposon RE1 [Vitis vinifera]|uniref:Retrovirus-related Pol polyprotein from transposon RE1 n=1 Tax=Vitis vinifera TaxID=29760 RepID=A0A438KNS7_VITVI|nr:Retrovirus-related Pol polyprotein from transposon RE1 [Vitis vinifera]